MMRTDSFIFFK